MSTQKIDDLGYLLHSLASLLDRQSDALLQERLDIGFSQFKILLSLKWGEGVQQKEIAASLGQTEASVSRQIALLQDVKLITIRTDKTDRRKNQAYLTLKGERLVNKAIKALNDYHQPVFARLSFSQQQQFKQMLETMHTQASLYKA